MFSSLENGRAKSKDELNLNLILEKFVNAIDSFKPPVKYTIEKKIENDFYAIVADFNTKHDDTYQFIVLKWHIGKICSIDNKDQISDYHGLLFGPGGAGYNIDFCANNKQYTVMFSGKLHIEDIEHGIDSHEFVSKMKEIMEDK